MAEYINRKAVLETADWYVNEYCESRISFQNLYDELKRIPAADVAPVRHGRWIRREGFDYENNVILGACSKCDWEVKDFTNYCPNCGARMGGDGDV